MYQKWIKIKDFSIKIHEIICYQDNEPQNKYLPGQKTSKNILPGLEPEKVENHWLRVYLL